MTTPVNRRNALAALAISAAASTAGSTPAVGKRRRKRQKRTYELELMAPVSDVETKPGRNRHTYRLTLVDDRVHHAGSGRTLMLSKMKLSEITFTWLSPNGHHAVVTLKGDVDTSTPGIVTVVGEPVFHSVIPNPDAPESGGTADAALRYAACAPGFVCPNCFVDATKCITTFVPCDIYPSPPCQSTGFCSLC